ncbi:hypothetical protein [Variovorax saccharolyticus]|uniref:hypothetical protein n=1 Tax=Variovorax saccharolyticus TaxID=3053516 RepID=UPI0025766BFB|nr:hypothetical protein [Variovorax sp. J31P216]MDM0029110.1 hypothetical protein [Variovorax sp. J31P216]
MSDLISSFLKASIMPRFPEDAADIPRKPDDARKTEHPLKGQAGETMPDPIDSSCNEFENGKSVVVAQSKKSKTLFDVHWAALSRSMDLATEDLAEGGTVRPFRRLANQHGGLLHECMGINIGKLWKAVEQAYQNGHGGAVLNLHVSFGNESKKPDPEKRLYLDLLVSKGDCSLIRQQAEQLGGGEFCRFVGKNFLSYCSAFSEATRNGHGSAVTQLISDMANLYARQEKKTNLNAADQLNTLEYQKIMTAEATECIKNELKSALSHQSNDADSDTVWRNLVELIATPALPTKIDDSLVQS